MEREPAGVERDRSKTGTREGLWVVGFLAPTRANGRACSQASLEKTIGRVASARPCSTRNASSGVSFVLRKRGFSRPPACCGAFLPAPRPPPARAHDGADVIDHVARQWQALREGKEAVSLRLGLLVLTSTPRCPGLLLPALILRQVKWRSVIVAALLLVALGRPLILQPVLLLLP